MNVKRIFIVVFLLLILASAWAEEKSYEVTLTLTSEQLKSVKSGYGRSVAVKFTAAQLAAIREFVPEFNLTEMRLTSSLVGRGSKILLVIKVYEDPRGLIFEANPQPSP
ncbi:MAG TPA: hypothetical protein ENN88_00835 [Candidatus Coatesbacteria bacterium]|nr:hypothetical protein [Candidatus Coatesbacteria bacterium]